MYTDTTVDGILKGLDQQVYSMRYNIIDSAMCVVLVLILIPKYSVKGYVAILFISEIVNFSLSIHRLSKVCTLEINIMDSIRKPAVCVTASFLAGLLLSSAQGSGKAALTIIITVNAAGVYSSADAHGQHLGAGYYLVQKHLFARLKI